MIIFCKYLNDCLGLRNCRSMLGDIHIIHLPIRVATRQGLLVEYIEDSGFETVGIERIDERIVINCRSATGVNYNAV